MIDLAKTRSGEIGDGEWFSSLLLAAIRSQFTGGILVETNEGDAAVFFRGGRPVHASGQGFRQHYLGQVLVDRSICPEAALQQALAEQKDASGPRPLLGALLVRNGVDQNEIKRAIQVQTKSRLGRLISVPSGTWKAAPGDDPRVREVGVPLDPWPIFFELLQLNAAAPELSHQATDLLGSAVKVLRGGLPEHSWTDDERRLLKYLEKPRKPDQLERALGSNKRRTVRGFLRAMSLLGKLSIEPAHKATPITKTLKHTGIPLPVTPSTSDLSSTDIPSTTIDTPSTIGHRVRSVSAVGRSHPLVNDIVTFHGKMSNWNHFELLGVPENVAAAEIKRRYHDLLKKYHPDAWPPEIDRDGPVAMKAREISARLNDARDILTDEAKREDYLTILHDERIKGDYRKREKIKEAGLKAKMGAAHLNKKEYAKAKELFEFAHQNDPSSGMYQAYLAWVIFEAPSGHKDRDTETAYRMLVDALKKEDQEGLIHLFMARVLKSRGERKEAIHHFRRVLDFSPNHTEANSEIRYLRKRLGEEEASKKTGLAKLFDFDLSSWTGLGGGKKKPAKKKSAKKRR